MSPRIDSVNVSVRLSDEAQSAVREAIVGPLVAYNAQQTGRNDYPPGFSRYFMKKALGK